MFIAFVEANSEIERSEEGETFDEFVTRIREDDLFYLWTEAEFATIIPTEVIIRRKEVQ